MISSILYGQHRIHSHSDCVVYIYVYLCCSQVSSIGLYLSGLIVFAVVLSLIEQSVLQVYETRVELGSPVQETVSTISAATAC